MKIKYYNNFVQEMQNLTRESLFSYMASYKMVTLYKFVYHFINITLLVSAQKFIFPTKRKSKIDFDQYTFFNISKKLTVIALIRQTFGFDNFFNGYIPTS